jgi:uncharacterized protein YecE (DUF72 family)
MIYIGTSGYGYHNWSPIFYPSWLFYEDYLDFYSEQFNCCELTFTRYRMPTVDDQERLLRRSAGRLVFTVKAHRRLTHQRPLETKDMSLARRFAVSLAPLTQAQRLGAVVAQFPFSFINNPDHRAYVCRLRTALDGLPVVAEFRHDSWFNEETLHFLRGWDVGVACVDTPQLARLPGPRALVTSELGYVRFHGRNAFRWWKWWAKEEGYRYDYNYRRRELLGWVPRLREIERQSKHTFVIFNNHWQGQAVVNAQALQKILKRSRSATVAPRTVATHLRAG